MKVLKEIIVHKCDFCKESSSYECLNCRKDICYACVKFHNGHYQGNVNFFVGTDGYYCKECNESLLKSGESKLFNAYNQIRKFNLKKDAVYIEHQKETIILDELVGALFRERKMNV